jgi:orotidine-5'-phosphate decarboxylase
VRRRLDIIIVSRGIYCGGRLSAELMPMFYLVDMNDDFVCLHEYLRVIVKNTDNAPMLTPGIGMIFMEWRG